MIHLIYPHRNTISAPDVIGHTLAGHLRQSHEVTTHNFDSLYRIRPRDGDVLIGHAHPFRNTVFRRSVRMQGWGRRILLQPFNGDWRQVGFIDDVIDECDRFLAITGSYWFNQIANTPAERWGPKMIHLDLAVSRSSFPALKRGTGPKGKRRVLYIGNDHPGKNLPYLNAVAGAWKNGEIHWAGRGRSFEHLKPLGFLDFSSAEGRAIVEQYDFLITLGSADANPTTVLEAMSWGLVPICTPTSGYVDERCIVNVPPDDVEAVCQKLDELQFADDTAIMELRRIAEKRMEDHFNWARFCAQVEESINSTKSPAIVPKNSSVASSELDWNARTIVRLIIKNIGYAIEKYWPSFTFRKRSLNYLRDFLGM